MSAVGFVAFCVANATARVARRTHFSWLTLRYTSKLAHSAITLAWLATNPICGWVGCSLRRKDLRHRSFFRCVSSGIRGILRCKCHGARCARRTHFSWLTRLFKRHCGDDNKHAYLRAQVYQHIPSDAHNERVAIQEAQKGHERRLLVYGIFLHARWRLSFDGVQAGCDVVIRNLKQLVIINLGDK